jgi:arylsulfatase A-like enzyme
MLTANSGGNLAMSGWNYPLRGGKYTLFEGGTRVSAFISGGAVPAAVRGTTSDSLIHEVDWLPTLLSLAGAKPSQKIDGVAQWEALTVPGTAPARTGLIYNIDPVANLSGIRYATRTTLRFSEYTCGLCPAINFAFGRHEFTSRCPALPVTIA